MTLRRIRLTILLTMALAVSVLAIHKYMPTLFAGKPVPIQGGEPLFVRVSVEPYLQLDPRWQSQELGESSCSMGSYGCTVCATAMALTSQGFAIDPADLALRLSEGGSFTESGLLIWRGVETLTEGQFQVKIVDRPTHHTIDRQLKAGNPLMAKVLFQDRIWHWVLISGKEGDRYLMHDPLGTGTAHDDMEEFPKGIFAIRHLRKS